MRFLWLVIGVLIAVGLFIFYPGLFHTLVSWVQQAVHWIQGLVGSHTGTNVTGG